MTEKKKLKPKPKAEAPKFTRAQQVMQLMAKEKPEYKQTIFDPDDPGVIPTRWINMPVPWSQLTGVRGIPFGHVTTIQGRPDSGKSTLAMHAMVEAQNQGFNVVLIDTEFKFNYQRFRDMGGSLDDMVPLKCQTVEQGFTAIDDMIKHFSKVDKGTPILFVWDSLGMTPVKAQLDGAADRVGVAEAARMIKSNIRREMAKINDMDVAIIFVNHVYTNIAALFGNSTKGYGGDGPAFASVLVLEVQRIRDIVRQKNNVKVVVAKLSGVKCTKNHLSAVQGGAVQIKIGPTGIVTGETELLANMDEVIDLKTGKGHDDVEMPELDEEEQKLGMI